MQFWRLYLTVGQYCWPGSPPLHSCRMDSMTAQILWSCFLVRQDWRLYSAVGQGCKSVFLPEQGYRTGSIAPSWLETQIRQNCQPSFLAREDHWFTLQIGRATGWDLCSAVLQGGMWSTKI